jgi:antitoxin ParD1/3/4
MPTRNVVLTPRQEKFINSLVASGKYQNASEVLREGLRLVEARDAEHRARLKALRDAVKLGIDDIEAARYREFESFDQLDTFLRDISGKAISTEPGQG